MCLVFFPSIFLKYYKNLNSSGHSHGNKYFGTEKMQTIKSTKYVNKRVGEKNIRGQWQWQMIQFAKKAKIKKPHKNREMVRANKWIELKWIKRRLYEYGTKSAYTRTHSVTHNKDTLLSQCTHSEHGQKNRKWKKSRKMKTKRVKSGNSSRY